MTTSLLHPRAAMLAGLLVALGAGSTLATEATGTWLTQDARARVRTERCGADGAHLCGYIVWRDPKDPKASNALDQANPDPAKRGRAVLGHQVILGLKPDGNGRHEGRIYDADSGKSYDVTVWSERPAELSVRGCLMTLLCMTQTWTRVTDIAAGQLRGATNGEGGPRSDSEWATLPTSTDPVRGRKLQPSAH